MPAMADVARASTDVDFIFANQGEGANTIRSFLHEAGIELETVVIDPASRISRHYRAVGMPTTLFITADGSLAGMHMGEISRELLAERVAEMRQANGDPGVDDKTLDGVLRPDVNHWHVAHGSEQSGCSVRVHPTAKVRHHRPSPPCA